MGMRSATGRRTNFEPQVLEDWSGNMSSSDSIQPEGSPELFCQPRTAHRRRSHRCGIHRRCCAREPPNMRICEGIDDIRRRENRTNPRTARRRRLAALRTTAQVFAKSVWFAVYNRSGQTVKVHDANKDRTTAVVPGDRVYLSGSSFLGQTLKVP